VVPHDAGAQHGGLDSGIRVEPRVGPSSERGRERRLGGAEVGDMSEALGVDLEHGFGDEQEVGDGKVDHAATIP
jgi:hypothetical protein